MEFKLKKKLEYMAGDKKVVVEKVTLDFDKVTIKDIYEADEDAKMEGVVIQNLEYTLPIQWAIVSKASGLPKYVDSEMAISDVLKLCREAKAFLLGIR